MKFKWMSLPVFAPEDGSGGEDASFAGESVANITTPNAANAAEERAPERVLFPSEGRSKEETGGDGNENGHGHGNGYAKSGEEANSTQKNGSDADAAKDDGGEETADTPDVVPADGKYELKMPDGVEIDQSLLDELSPEFKEIGLTTGQAQKLADRFAAHQRKQADEYMSEPLGQYTAAASHYFRENGTPDTWADTAKSDKDIGRDKWAATTLSAARAVNALGTPELKAFLNASGSGNHPELIRVFAKVGNMISEDDPASGGMEGQGRPAEPAYSLFPNDVPKG